MTTADWAEIRREFPALSKWTFLNTATYGQTPRVAQEAMRKHLSRRDELACTDFLEWFDDIQVVRESCAKLVNCQDSDIAFVHNASVGLATFLNGIDWANLGGGEVLTVENEFPNNLYQAPVLERHNIRFRVVPYERLLEECGPDTRAVLLSTLNYGTGFRAPVEQLGPELRKRGILLYLDGTQGCGALRFDMQVIRPAVFCVDAYKWMLTPNGGGFLYVDPELRPKLAPTVAGWRSDRNWRQVNNLNHGDPVFSDDAERYEGGMVVFPSLYAMGAVIGMMLEIGVDQVERRALALADQTRDILREAGADVNEEASPIVSARFEGRDAGELALRLKEHRVVVSARHGRLRVSTHFYNNEEDLDTLRRVIVGR